MTPMPSKISSESERDQHIHVPTPGDHYTPITGSAVMTIIYELSRWHLRQGGETRLVVGRGTRHDYPIGECTEVNFPALPGKLKKVLDLGLGRLGLPRHFGTALYRPASAVIPSDFKGTLIVWNNPVALRMFRAAHPHATLCLYAQNSLFRTYTVTETRKLVEATDRVICCSQYIADELLRKLGQPNDKVRSVLNGVDTERFRPPDEAQNEEVPTVLFVGRALPEKGPDLILRAAQKITGPKRKFKVRIVGSSNFNANDPLTPYEQELRTLAEPIRDQVTFQPFVDRARVLDEFHAASIFCVPSNWDDPCPLTVPEGMACGLPMIVSRRGGIPEEGADAVLYFRPPDVDEFAERLAYLVDDAAARKEWGAKARARAEALSWENQYLKLRAELHP